MNLLLINYEFPPVGGGGSTAAWQMALILRKLGHEVFVLTTSFGGLKGWSEEDGIHVYRAPCLRAERDHSHIYEMVSFMLSACWNIGEVVKKAKPGGAIAFFSIPSGPVALLANLRYGVPYIVSLRGGDVPGHVKWLGPLHLLLLPLRRFVFRRSAAVVANSQALKKLSESVDPAHKVLFIPNGADAEYFCPGPARPCGDSGRTRLLFVGRISEEKNLEFVLSSLAALTSRGKADFALEVVGEGPARPALQNGCARLGIADIVVWRGWISRQELRDVYQRSDCLISSSSYEGMSNVVIEAMACGLPVIASAIPSNAALVREGETGLLFKLNDEESFSAAVLRAAGSKTALADMGLAAREYVRKNYSWDNTAQRYVRLFKS